MAVSDSLFIYNRAAHLCPVQVAAWPKRDVQKMVVYSHQKSIVSADAQNACQKYPINAQD
jgi:hypothetical protein